MEPRLLQIGPPKCGNYWLYNIIQQLYRLKGIGYKSYISKQPVFKEAQNWDLSHSLQSGIDMMDIERGKCFYRISSVFRNPIHDLKEYLSQTNHVWTHSEVGEHIMPVLRSFDKLIYIYRDPRDMAVSAARYAFTPYMMKYYPHQEESIESYLHNNLHEIIQSWNWHVMDYLLLKDNLDIHFIAYERLLKDFIPTLQQMSDFLHLPITQKEAMGIAEEVDFARLQKKDPGHVKKGTRFQWLEVLNHEQQEMIIDMSGNLLDLLGYPYCKSDQLPVNANDLPINEIQVVARQLRLSGREVKN